MEPKNQIEYSKLGSGLKVSKISYGNLTWDDEKSEELYFNIIKRCFELGINQIDTHEAQTAGLAETLLGRILKKINKPRDEYVISTKLFQSRGWRNYNPPNTTGLCRKHIYEGAMNSLKRLQLEQVDVIFGCRCDQDTPMEEICRGFNWLIDNGKCFYWGTSEWTSTEIMEAYEVCDRLGLARPIVEQPKYHMFHRSRMEIEQASLFEKQQMGTTIWSPLAAGFLTGKYLSEIPKGSRAECSPDKHFHFDQLMAKPEVKEKNFKILQSLNEVSKSLNCSLAQLAIAWTLKNKDVSTALVGATSVKQLEENVGAMNVVGKLTNSVEEQIEKILNNKPMPPLDWKTMQPQQSRR